MSESRQLKAIRSMAWERAKGEMRSMLHTYYSEFDGDKFERFRVAMDEFVSLVEFNVLEE